MKLTDFAKTISLIRKHKHDYELEEMRLKENVLDVFKNQFGLKTKTIMHYNEGESFSFYLEHKNGLIYIGYYYETTEFILEDFQIDNEKLKEDILIFLERLNNIEY